MNKRLLPLLSVALLASFCTAAVAAQSTPDSTAYLNIELVGVSKQLQFKRPARLADVLKQAQQQDLVLQYPLGTTLFDSSEDALRESTKLKDSVLIQMIKHGLTLHPLYSYIHNHQFAPRILSSIDVDLIRLDKFKDPLISGDLTLVSPPREEKIIYLGNLDHVYAIKDQAGIPLKQQMTNLRRDRDLGELAQPPVLIYPDGKIVQPQHGSWLTTQYYLPPLTMVYIPFEKFETSKMDQGIVQLLTQLKPAVMKKPL